MGMYLFNPLQNKYPGKITDWNKERLGYSTNYKKWMKPYKRMKCLTLSLLFMLYN